MKRLSGIRLQSCKHAENQKTEAIPLPQSVRIPMLMHMGTPCIPAVQPGDQVALGQIIGTADDDNAVPIHASVSGTVTAVSDYHTASGETVPCVEIESDGKQTVFEGCCPPVIASKADLIAAAKASGCVGLGGSGDLTYQKLEAGKKIDFLVVNGAECEPYLTSDCRRMIENAGDIIGGIRLIMQWLKIKNCRIGVSSEQPAALKTLAYACGSESAIQVMPLPPRYPQGAERVMIYHTTGRVVPEGKTPADIGVLLLNVSTCAFLYQYSKNGIPLTERVVTVAGDAVQRPCNLRVPVGTPLRELLKFAGCDFNAVNLLLSGGTMMGEPLSSFDEPVRKPMNGLIALKKVSEPTASACIRCGRCMNVCPMHLMPMKLERAYQKGNAAKLSRLHLSLCMNCGCCTYICPAKRPIAQNLQLAKVFLADSMKKEGQS